MTDGNLGRILANRYELIKSVGQGAMGTVYLAKDRVLGDVSVAVKLLSQDVLNDRSVKQFQIEATISALLGQKCMHVVRVIDQKFTQEGQPFYVMEYLAGKNIRQLIRPQPLDIPRFLELARQTCIALKAAHDGILFNDRLVPIIHRDIKPSNILVTKASSGELVKVLDFGIAKLLQGRKVDEINFMGTMAYSSPEQMDGQELDYRTDIYSLGITMYEMLTGALPYQPRRNTFGGWHKAHTTYAPRPLKSIIPLGTSPKLLNGVSDLVMSCLSRNRSRRPESVDEILTTLMALQRDGVTPSKPLSFQFSEDTHGTLPTPPPSEVGPDVDWFLRSQTWPQKNAADLENPLPKMLLLDDEKPLATLWLKLSAQEITQRANSTRYNTFLCTMHPYPMVLWVTAFYSSTHGYSWWANYLHPKKNGDRKFLWQLSDAMAYHALLFSQRPPNAVVEICKFNIAKAQCKLLKQWVLRAQATPSVGKPEDSQALLERELEKLQKKGF
ncbi:serine/threonine protein kinase [Leptothoe kymatousa]|uniref:Serine/threonine protein kinase n=1 Tax=Leptothoe kymatousa TAU-MAC 1615 TaxID=2364775 RepID=A0ABS5XYH5_9CYAN|nr:serine/threonine-protein kinase [Leptothoe kymatousa]MBT9310680.1 serine/threonine protein kinase [Leptothoe kymatousa TAU-MAC 1615]